MTSTTSSDYTPFALVFFVFAALATSGLVVFAAQGGERVGVLGGPDAAPIEGTNMRRLAMLAAATPPGGIPDYVSGGMPGTDEQRDFLTDGTASLSNKGAVFGGSLTKRARGLLIYKVQEGDTLSQIAAQFGISAQTILWANEGVKSNLIRPGDELTILPASGVLHKVKVGDTVASLAASFDVDGSRIVAINRLENPGALVADEYLVIPDAKPLRSLASLSSSYERRLPALSGFFAFPMPQNSWNWGVLHRDNAVDIANVCGTPIYAAAQGVVTSVGNPDRWNSGYGGYVALEHSNGAKTLYAHTRENLVVVGDFVNQGDTIAGVGSTGNVNGSTGCHLHFEVDGARNPFVK